MPGTDQPPSATKRPVVPLLIIVLGLAVATIWFVALPQLDRTAEVKRTCEVIVLGSGKTRCVANPKARAKTPHRKAAKKPSGRVAQ